VTPPKSLCLLPSCTPSPLQGGLAVGSGWKRLRFGIAGGKRTEQEPQSPAGTWGSTRCHPCVGSVPKSPQSILLRGDRGRIPPRAPAPGGDTAPGSISTPGTDNRDTVAPTEILGARLQLLQVHHLLADHAAVVVVCRDVVGTRGVTGCEASARPTPGLVKPSVLPPPCPPLRVFWYGGAAHLSQGAPAAAGG